MSRLGRNTLVWVARLGLLVGLLLALTWVGSIASHVKGEVFGFKARWLAGVAYISPERTRPDLFGARTSAIVDLFVRPRDAIYPVGDAGLYWWPPPTPTGRVYGDIPVAGWALALAFLVPSILVWVYARGRTPFVVPMLWIALVALTGAWLGSSVGTIALQIGSTNAKLSGGTFTFGFDPSQVATTGGWLSLRVTPLAARQMSFWTWDWRNNLIGDEIDVPGWVGILPLLILLIVIARIRRLKRNRKLNLCPRCGYDLTGNISGICPECGNAVKKSPVPARQPGADALSAD